MLQKIEKILTTIFKCIEFCDRQGIPLRSHRDDDKTFDDNTNMGNLKELLKLCCDLGNDELKEHLQSRKRNIHLKQHRMNFWVLLNYICSVKSSKE